VRKVTLAAIEEARRLARSLAEAFTARGRERSLAELEGHLGSGDPAALVELAGELAEINGGEEPNVLVVIDQAEELITRTGEREQQAFLRLLGAPWARRARCGLLPPCALSS
jgi:hypothetical protein